MAVGLKKARARKTRLNAVEEYWMKYYVNDGLCSLCGNTGIIDTTGVCTPAGVEVGRKNFCICPNGQARRWHAESEEL